MNKTLEKALKGTATVVVVPLKLILLPYAMWQQISEARTRAWAEAHARKTADILVPRIR